MSALGTQRARARVRSRRGDGGAGCERPGAAGRIADDSRTLFDDLGGEPTLDEFIAGAWEGLATHDHIACPLCGGRMEAVDGAHSRPAAGRCTDCGTELS